MHYDPNCGLVGWRPQDKMAGSGVVMESSMLVKGGKASGNSVVMESGMLVKGSQVMESGAVVKGGWAVVSSVATESGISVKSGQVVEVVESGAVVKGGQVVVSGTVTESGMLVKGGKEMESNMVVEEDEAEEGEEAEKEEESNEILVAKVFIEEVVCWHGAPEALLLDQGQQFLSKVLKEVNELLGEKGEHSTLPPPDRQPGQTLQQHTQPWQHKDLGPLKGLLAKVTNKKQDNWDLYMPYVLFAYCTSMHEATQDSPFYLLHGWEANLPG